MRLIVDTGPAAGTQVQLERDRQFLLGSAEDCAVRIQQPGVQPHHAVVKALKDQGYGVKALAPGLRVNGRDTDAAILADGDTLELGITRLTFTSAEPKKTALQIAGYKILGELGRGGMGMVYRAEQVSLRREVALKVLNHKLTVDPAFVQKFVAEAHAAAKLSHPNVVQVFDVNHDGDVYYYSMELMHEGSLEAWLKKNGRMPVERALQVVADAALGLAYAESLDIVHRDIKPDNLMLDQHGNVKIADLGLARTDEDSDDSAAGTPHFMAPEAVQRKGVDHRTDLYALGCTFFRLVTGKTPFRGATSKDILRAQLKDEPELAHKVEPSVPPEVSAIIGKLLQKDPAARFQSANDLREAVMALLQPPAKKGKWIALAAAAVLVAGAAVLWAINKPKEQTIVEKYKDNPEMLRLAQRNEELEKQAREDKATIALLEARVSGSTGLTLAEAIERVATAHGGTAAATTANELARRLRTEEQQRAAADNQRKERVDAALRTLRGELEPLVAAHDMKRAFEVLAKPAPTGMDGDALWTSGHADLRKTTEQAAAMWLQAVRSALDTAKAGQDAAGLQKAIADFEAIVADGSGWPGSLIQDRSIAQSVLANARSSLAALHEQKVASQWQRLATTLRQGTLLQALRGNDFAAAATVLRAFADGAGEDPAGAHARSLAQAIELGNGFAELLAAGLPATKVQLPAADGSALLVLRFARESDQLTVSEVGRKPAREVPLALSALDAAQWAALLDAFPTAPAGCREAFLTWRALQQHVDAATAYLQRLVKDDDLSGTGAAGYPLPPSLLDLGLRRLPDPKSADWANVLDQELRAGHLLVRGLRALSERRNLGAAAQLEKLLVEHPHSLAATMLP